LLKRVLFQQTTQAHHRFQMIDRESGRELTKAIEVHTIELTKYNLNDETVSQASKLEQWAFLMLYAQDYEVDVLKRLLPAIEFGPAIDTLRTISAKTEDKQMYDQREKAQRDYEWAMSSVREEGREEGLEEGLDKGELIGIIRTLQEVLGETPTEKADLKSRSLDALAMQLAELRQLVRHRQA
jgi:flagellar biosynthesis/type III secretory pathway protein FliH